jgi:hypothetical protein
MGTTLPAVHSLPHPLELDRWRFATLRCGNFFLSDENRIALERSRESSK